MNSTGRTSQSQPAIELHGVGVLAGDRWIVRDVTLALPVGVCCALVGPNGCGKSTLARVLAGFTWATRGRVSVLGRIFGKTDLHALRREVKLVQPGAPVDFDPALPARDVVLSGVFGTVGLFHVATPQDRSRAEGLMDRVGISSRVDSPFGTLSTGERMRTLIARALMHPPALLLLDEPTAGLDLVGRALLLAGLDAIMSLPDRPTVLLISHHLEELPRSTDWAMLMSEGRVTRHGPVEQVLVDEAMTEAFGASLIVNKSGGRWSAGLSGVATARPWSPAD